MNYDPTPKLACSRCEQDWVAFERIRETGEVIQTCAECEATWLRGRVPIVPNHVQLSVMLRERGLGYESVEDAPEFDVGRELNLLRAFATSDLGRRRRESLLTVLSYPELVEHEECHNFIGVTITFVDDHVEVWCIAEDWEAPAHMSLTDFRRFLEHEEEFRDGWPALR